MHKRIQSVDCANCAPGEDDAFFVADLGEVYRLHAEWKRRLGRVTPFYGASMLKQIYQAPKLTCLQQQNAIPIRKC